MGKSKILMIDDDDFFLKMYRKSLQEEYELFVAMSSVEGLKLLQEKKPDLLLLDISMKTEKEGVQILPLIKKQFPSMPIIIVTNHDSHTIYKEAIAAGADDFFVKSDDLKALHIVLNNRLSDRKEKFPAFPGFIYRSDAMKSIIHQVQKSAQAAAPVVISGETGTGKEIIARFIHHVSSRTMQPFVALNCGAITETMLEDTFFGHKKGAFTGALSDKKGCFEKANGGTLFLDELEDLSPKGQTALLRVIQEREIQPLGSAGTLTVDVRILCALKGDLYDLVKVGRFREDLYYRLAVFEIKLPPLRERAADIIPLFRHFLEKSPGSIKKVSQNTLLFLQSYSWPGNVRQLENAVKRVCAMADGPLLRIRDFSFLLENDIGERIPYEIAKQEALNSFRVNYITKALARNKGNRTAAAKDIGISRQALQNIIKELAFDKTNFLSYSE